MLYAKLAYTVTIKVFLKFNIIIIKCVIKKSISKSYFEIRIYKLSDSFTMPGSIQIKMNNNFAGFIYLKFSVKHFCRVS